MPKRNRKHISRATHAAGAKSFAERLKRRQEAKRRQQSLKISPRDGGPPASKRRAGIRAEIKRDITRRAQKAREQRTAIAGRREDQKSNQRNGMMEACTMSLQSLRDALCEVRRELETAVKQATAMRNKIADARVWLKETEHVKALVGKRAAVRRAIVSWQAQVEYYEGEQVVQVLEEALRCAKASLDEGVDIPPVIRTGLSIYHDQNKKGARPTLFSWDMATLELKNAASARLASVMGCHTHKCTLCGRSMALVASEDRLVCKKCCITAPNDHADAVAMSTDVRNPGTRVYHADSYVNTKIDAIHAVTKDVIQSEELLSVLRSAYERRLIVSSSEMRHLQVRAEVYQAMKDSDYRKYKILNRVRMGMMAERPRQMTPRLRIELTKMMEMQQMVFRQDTSMNSDLGKNNLNIDYSLFHMLRHRGHHEFEDDITIIGNRAYNDKHFMQDIFRTLGWSPFVFLPLNNPEARSVIELPYPFVPAGNGTYVTEPTRAYTKVARRKNQRVPTKK